MIVRFGTNNKSKSVVQKGCPWVETSNKEEYMQKRYAINIAYLERHFEFSSKGYLASDQCIRQSQPHRPWQYEIFSLPS